MGAPDRISGLGLAAGLITLLLGCSGASEPEFAGRATEAKEEIERTKEAADAGEAAQIPEPSEEALAEAQAASAGDGQPVDPTAAVHFETANPGGDKAPKPTLFEAAEAERERRRTRPQTAIVITDANLSDYAKGGRLTEMTSDVEPAAEDASAAASTGDDDDPETYWRTRVRNARLAWRAAVDRIQELEDTVAELRYQFYATDDPAQRDLEIKPAWDRAAVDLTQASLRAADLETQVELTLEEGHDAGALPGWLREGLDFEPQTDDRDQADDGPRDAEVIEPPILEEPPA